MNQNKRPLLIAVTGNIGCGKSEAMREIKRSGYSTILADEVGHKLLKAINVQRQLKKMFDIPEPVDITREMIAELCFGNKDNLKKLNEFIHPLIRLKIKTMIADTKEKVLFIEIPLLFESNLENRFDFIVCITTDRKTQFERLQIRSKYTAKEISDRISAQMPQPEKILRSDLVINNDHDLNTLQGQIHVMLSMLKYIPRREVKELI